MAKDFACRSVVIVGGGPSGSTLAAILAGAGVQVVVFDLKKKADLVIGESLVPAIVPILCRLGVEEEVKSYSTLKPGATFYLKPNAEEVTFFFDRAGSKAPYAYNVPRDRFDQTLKNCARKAGAVFIDQRAKLVSQGGDKVGLEAESLSVAQAIFGRAPDYIVDATGRARLLAKELQLPACEGSRKDAALFAHLSHVDCAHKGNVHIDILDQGWSWRIPLPGRVSVGIVAPEEFLRTLGDTREQQYDAIISTNTRLRNYIACGDRVTRVMKYSNYQLVSHRFVGSGWALVGDAGGFVDPVFSSGLLVSMKGAEDLADALLKQTHQAMLRYERRTFSHISSWQKVVESFYSGRLMSLVLTGQEFRESPAGRLVSGHVERHISRVLTGTGIESSYSNGLLNFLLRHGLRNNNPMAHSISVGL